MHKHLKLTSVDDSVTRGEKLAQTPRLCRFLSKAACGLCRQVRNIYSADYAAARDNSSRCVRRTKRRYQCSLCKTTSIGWCPVPTRRGFFPDRQASHSYPASYRSTLLDRKLTEIQLQSDEQSDGRRRLSSDLRIPSLRKAISFSLCFRTTVKMLVKKIY